MPVKPDVVAVAAWSLAQQILTFLNEKQIIVDEEVQDLLKRARNPLVGTTGGPQLNAEVARLVGELGTSFSRKRASRPGE